MTTILQISDTHIMPSGALVSGRLDSARSLRRLVERVQDMREQIAPVDAVLISGDLSEDGSAESYQHLKQIIAPLGLPLFVIPGNHDARTPLRAAFANGGFLPASGKLNWVRPIGDLVLIGLDTLVEGKGGGVLDADTLAFLTDALHNAGDTPVLLALHHPPFEVGIRFMDKIGLRGIDALTDIVSRHPGDVRIVCGHIHCLMMASTGQKIAISAPSPCSSFEFDLRDDAPVGYQDAGDGFLIHRWHNGFQSVRVGIETGMGPFPF